MHIFLSGIPFNSFHILSLVNLYFTRIILSPPLIKSFCLLIQVIQSSFKGEPSPHFLHLRLCYCYAAGLESDFWRSLSIKAFCGELLSSCLLLSCIYGFHHHDPSLHFYISLESYLFSYCIVIPFIDQISFLSLLFFLALLCIFIIQIILHLYLHVYFNF